jgi:Leucine-rich repeat (LRR) protein
MSLPAEIAALESLERLYLRKNRLTALPEDLGGLKNLEWLLLEGNAFPEAEQKRIREALPNCNIEF